MSPDEDRDQATLRARLLAAAIAPVGAELMLVDPADYVAFIRFEQFANIQDIVNSSTELVFRPGTLNYSCSAEFQLDWKSAPQITIDMEFRHLGVCIAFRLILRACGVGVSIQRVLIEPAGGDAAQDTMRIADALASARLRDCGE